MSSDVYDIDLNTQREILYIKGVVGFDTVPLIGNNLLPIGWDRSL